MREKVLRYIRERRLMRAGDRVAVAVSGGADSLALLRVLLELRDELGIVLAAAHFNHGLRGQESLADEAFVAEVAKELGVDFFVGRGDVRDHAFIRRLSIEAAARELRYRWLTGLAAEQRFDAVATAHTLDDQAETVLLKFLRGAGTKGLAGIYPEREFEGKGDPSGVETHLGAEAERGGSNDARPDEFPALQNKQLKATQVKARFVRPMLGVTRGEVESYLEALGQQWREDESNLDRRFARNRVRHDLLPLLEREFNPNIRQVLSDAAELARAEEEYWQRLVEHELSVRVEGADVQPNPTSVDVAAVDAALKSSSAPRLNLKRFAELPIALQRRLLKRFAEIIGPALDFAHIEEVRSCALGKQPKTELPQSWIALHVRGWLRFRRPSPSPQSPADYEYVLPVPGEAHITELGLTVRAFVVAEEFAQELAQGELLRAESIGAQVGLRNWRAGDRFWPAHSASEEKLKRLFAEKRIPAERRPSWPIALCGEDIVWVRGFPVAKSFQWKGEGEAVRIEVIPDGAAE